MKRGRKPDFDDDPEYEKLKNRVSKNWVFTINNPTDEDYAALEYAKTGASYLVYSLEEGEKTHTPHLQGYIVRKEKSKYAGTRKLLGGRAWCRERMSATHAQAADYCKHTGPVYGPGGTGKYKGVAVNLVEYGEYIEEAEKGQAGKESEQNRWDVAKQAAKEGRFDDIPSEIYCRLTGNMHKIHERELSKRKAETIATLEHEWWYGEQETGKSSTAHKMYPIKYKKTIDKWWDGYDGEEVVLIEDIDPRAVKNSEQIEHWLKTWGDHYGFPAQVKHGFIGEIRPKKIIVTSQYSIDELFNKRDAAAIKRRYKERLFVKKQQ